jgi:hypothetical protein
VQGRISAAECRNLIGVSISSSLTDEEILSLRDQLYALAGVIVSAAAELDEKELELESNITPEPDAAIRGVLGWSEEDDESDMYDIYDIYTHPLTREEREELREEHRGFLEERFRKWMAD